MRLLFLHMDEEAQVHRARRPCWFAVLGLFFLGVASPAAEVPSHIFYHDMSVDWLAPAEYERLGEAEIRRWRGEMEDAGFRPFLSYWGDFLANPVGGRSQAASWMQLLVFGGELDLDRLVGIPGGSIVISAVDAAGSNLSLKIGNVFTVSQAYVMNTFSLYNLYYRQQLFDGRLDLHVGRMSAGQFFATIPAMDLVVSGAVNGNPTSLFLNAPYHATASASWAAHAKFKPVPEAYIEAGIFQASPRIGDPVYHGVDFSIRPGDGVLMMTELGWTPEFARREAASGKDSPQPGLKGLYTFGAYLSSYTMATFDGGTADNAYGFYAIAQQMVWRSRANADRYLSLWGGVTWSPQEELAQMPVMGMGGLIWQGLVPGREHDDVLLSFYTGGFSRDYADARASSGNGRPTSETVIEAGYLIQLTQSLQLQPDLQWIIRPGGTGHIPDALVLGFQVALLF